MPKTYKVNGPHAVFDTKPGDTFTADLPDEQHRLLTAYGHITELPSADDVRGILKPKKRWDAD